MLGNVITSSNTRGWATISKCLVEAIAFFSRCKGGYRSPFYSEEAHVRRDTELESCKQLGRPCMSGREGAKAGPQRGLNDLKLFCTCLPPWVWVDIGLVVAIHHLLKTFCMREELLTLWVLPPPARSRELLFPATFASRGPTCDHRPRGGETVTGQGMEGPWWLGSGVGGPHLSSGRSIFRENARPVLARFLPFPPQGPRIQIFVWNTVLRCG